MKSPETAPPRMRDLHARDRSSVARRAGRADAGARRDPDRHVPGRDRADAAPSANESVSQTPSSSAGTGSPSPVAAEQPVGEEDGAAEHRRDRADGAALARKNPSAARADEAGDPRHVGLADGAREHPAREIRRESEPQKADSEKRPSSDQSAFRRSALRRHRARSRGIACVPPASWPPPAARRAAQRTLSPTDCQPPISTSAASRTQRLLLSSPRRSCSPRFAKASESEVSASSSLPRRCERQVANSSRARPRKTTLRFADPGAAFFCIGNEVGAKAEPRCWSSGSPSEARSDTCTRSGVLSKRHTAAS